MNRVLSAFFAAVLTYAPVSSAHEGHKHDAGKAPAEKVR